VETKMKRTGLLNGVFVNDNYDDVYEPAKKEKINILIRGLRGR
jgi:hypothetical protein